MTIRTWMVTAVVAVCATGCSLATGVRQNTAAIGGSTKAILPALVRQDIDQRIGPCILPDDRGMNRFAARTLPDQCRLPLIRDTNSGQIA